MIYRYDPATDAHGVWVRSEYAVGCNACAVDGDYTRIALISSWLVREYKRSKPKMTDAQAVSVLFNRL